MNRINCPECGYVMGGEALRCPRCRFPIGKFSESGRAEGGDFVITQDEFSALRSEMADAHPWYTEIKDKKLLKKIIRIIIVTAVLCAVAAVVIFFADNSRIVNEPQVNSIKLSRKMKLNGENVIRITADEKNPFAAVFKDKKDGRMMYSVVDGGTGTIFLDEEMTAQDCEAVGYAGGYKIDIPDAMTFETGKSEAAEDGKYDCYLTISVQTDSSRNGIMLADISILGSLEKNAAIDVINGKGLIYRKVSGLKEKPNDRIAYVIPVFFIPVEPVTEEDYSITDEIAVTQAPGGGSFTVKGATKLNAGGSGFLTYRYELYGKDELFTRGNKSVLYENGQCSINDEYVVGKKIGEMTSYKVFFSGLLHLKPFPVQTETSSS